MHVGHELTQREEERGREGGAGSKLLSGEESDNLNEKRVRFRIEMSGISLVE